MVSFFDFVVWLGHQMNDWCEGERIQKAVERSVSIDAPCFLQARENSSFRVAAVGLAAGGLSITGRPVGVVLQVVVLKSTAGQPCFGLGLGRFVAATVDHRRWSHRVGHRRRGRQGRV